MDIAIEPFDRRAAGTGLALVARGLAVAEIAPQRTRCMMLPAVVALLRNCVLAPDNSACESAG
jgi:hypothetical protein